MNLLLSRVRRGVETLAPRGARVLVALSGGADSVALLFLLRELERDGELTVAGIAHLNHQLRGAESDGDEAFCRALAARLGLAFRADRVNVAALARERKRSVEDTARTVRYAFFDSAADGVGADAIAVAHTRDDQAETFLLRLLRGAGTRGLGSIRPRAGRVVRPLLDVPRAELRAYLAQRGEPFREDASNADVSIPRNRVRHELIPYLQEHFSSGIVDVLAREAALARQDEEFLQQHVNESTSGIVLTSDSTSVTLDAAALRTAPVAVASRVAQVALERMSGGRAVAFEHVQGLLALAGSGAAGSLSLPGQFAVRTGATIVLHQGSRARGVNAFAVPLSIPGEVELTPLRLAVAAQRLEPPAGRLRQWTARGSQVGVAADPLQLPLVVRSRRPGDRFRPLGAPGARKLQDFLVDRKVPRAERDALPLVVDAGGRIVWVVGQSVAEEFRVTDRSRGVILLSVRYLGGPG